MISLAAKLIVLTHMQAKNILIAVGGRATKLTIPGAEHAIISDDILDLPELPKKLAIVGGGYIALEFAGIYNNFGSETHVVYRQVCGSQDCFAFLHILRCCCDQRQLAAAARARIAQAVAHSSEQGSKRLQS